MCPVHAIRGWLRQWGPCLPFINVLQGELTNNTAYVPCLVVPLDSELWVMRSGKMFTLGSGDPWEGEKRPGVGTTWSFFFYLFSVVVQGFMIPEENMET